LCVRLRLRLGLGMGMGMGMGMGSDALNLAPNITFEATSLYGLSPNAPTFRPQQGVEADDFYESILIDSMLDEQEKA